MKVMVGQRNTIGDGEVHYDCLLLGKLIVLLKNNPMKFHELHSYTESLVVPELLIRVSQPLFSESACSSQMAIKTLEAHEHIYDANFKVRQDKYILSPLGTINKAQDSESDLVFNYKQ